MISVTPTHRKIAIAVDLSDESAYAVSWAVENYLRPGDHVILLHVRPTCVLYGADWGSNPIPLPHNNNNVRNSQSVPPTTEASQRKLEDDFDTFTTTKASSLAQPLVKAQIPYRIHIVKDHDMKERLCLEVERLGLSAVVMGSRGFGADASKRTSKAGRLGSVSDYCVHHCVCPVVVVRYPDEREGAPDMENIGDEVELHTVPEEEHEYHDAPDEPKGMYILYLNMIMSFWWVCGYIWWNLE